MQVMKIRLQMMKTTIYRKSANKESESDDVSIKIVSYLEAIEAIKTLMKYMSVSSLCSHSICTPSGVYV